MQVLHAQGALELVQEQEAAEQRQSSPSQAQRLLEVLQSDERAAASASRRAAAAGDSSGVLQGSSFAVEAGTAAGGSSGSGRGGSLVQRGVALAQALLELGLTGATCALLLLATWEVVVLALVAGRAREFAAGGE
jgi:hypothetical protein